MCISTSIQERLDKVLSSLAAGLLLKGNFKLTTIFGGGKGRSGFERLLESPYWSSVGSLKFS